MSRVRFATHTQLQKNLLIRNAYWIKTRPCTTVRNSECQLLEESGWVVIGIPKSRQHEHIWFVSCCCCYQCISMLHSFSQNRKEMSRLQNGQIMTAVKSG